MHATNALLVSQAIIANRLAEARDNGIARASRKPTKRIRIPLIQLLATIGRLTPRPA
jgi:hypothetical protein